MRRFYVQLEPTRAAVFAAEDIAVLLRRVHSIEVDGVKGKSFHEALVGSRNFAVDVFPALAGIQRLNQEGFRPRRTLSPLARLSIGQRGINSIGFFGVNRQRD